LQTNKAKELFELQLHLSPVRHAYGTRPPVGPLPFVEE
jgi:hypothetical protein